MRYIVEVIIGRAVAALDRPFSYYSDEFIQKGMRVLVSFGSSKQTMGFVLNAEEMRETLEEYQQRTGVKLAKILRIVDHEPLLDEILLTLAEEVSRWYKSDLIKVLSSFLPPSLKPKDSALKKPQAKEIDFVFACENYIGELSKNEKTLYDKLIKSVDGIKKTEITAKKALSALIEKGAAEIKKIPVSRIPEIVAKHMRDYELSEEQKKAFDAVYHGADRIYLLQGVTGSGKTALYITLCQQMLKENKGCLILIPEIALTHRIADLFAAYFKGSISILHSSLSDSRKYDEYIRILHGESKIVLGTRSAIFSPVRDLGLIIIDEEHSSSYKQDSEPYYDAITIATMRARLEGAKVLLGSATPRIIDTARAKKGLYHPLRMDHRFSAEQEKKIEYIDMNNSALFDPMISSMFSKRLIDEIAENLKRKEQTMILLNRRGYSPIYICRSCNRTALCPNCGISLNYHKRQDLLKCHHCGYQEFAPQHRCDRCGGEDFLTLGYGTERAETELKAIYPTAKIRRLDSDVCSNQVREETLQLFEEGEIDILIGTQLIAKGHDFPNVTLGVILDADTSLRFPTFMANEMTFDLISQFVGRAGRGQKKGKTLIQTYCPDNVVIQLAGKQDYDAFYDYEMTERKIYKYPPYTLLANISIKGVDHSRVVEVAKAVKIYLIKEIGTKRFDVFGPLTPYIPHINGRYYRNILIKYKNRDEADVILDGIKTLRLANKDVEIQINMDPASEIL